MLPLWLPVGTQQCPTHLPSAPSSLWLDTQIQRLPGGMSPQPPEMLLSEPQMPLLPLYTDRMGYQENVKMLA